jgi:hypothetical protein
MDFRDYLAPFCYNIHFLKQSRWENHKDTKSTKIFICSLCSLCLCGSLSLSIELIWWLTLPVLGKPAMIALLIPNTEEVKHALFRHGSDWFHRKTPGQEIAGAQG